MKTALYALLSIVTLSANGIFCMERAQTPPRQNGTQIPGTPRINRLRRAKGEDIKANKRRINFKEEADKIKQQ